MSLFEESVKNANMALENWAKVMEFLQGAEGPGGEKFNQEAEVPATGQALRWFDERAIAICNLIKSLEKVEIDSGVPIPLDYVGQLEQASRQFKDIILELTNFIEQAYGKSVTDLNPFTWEITINETGQHLNFASSLQNFKTYAEALLTNFYQVSPIVGARKFDAFAEAVRDISEKTDNVRKNAKDISEAKKSAESDASATNVQKNQVEINQSEVLKILESAQKKLKDIETVKQTSQSEVTKISRISNEAHSLKSQVDGYETQFQEFQQSLDDRNTAFKKWSKDVENLYDGLKKNKEQIGDVIKRAEEMLEGATNAGLASTFNTTLVELDKKLKGAQGIFYFSIFFLLLSALPLALYVALEMGSFEPQTDASSGAAKGIWGNLALAFNGKGLSLSTTIALFLLMLPGVWLTKFSAARHHQLFQLKEHYHYKYSLAMAVDGFKKQAPEHADAIAAEIFNRLLFNPADRLEGKNTSDEHPSPLMNWLMNKLGFNSEGKEK